MTDTAVANRTANIPSIERRPFTSLGHADHGWLDARHHFSFANYYDPDWMSWGAIRVWNDDTIAPNSGFPPHPHRDMEIITYVRSGAITHKDSMGNTGRTAAGDVQVMSAGSGVRHAEYNLEAEPTTLFQIWIEPTRTGGSPSWGAKPFPKGERSGKFVTLASGFADDGDALPIRAEARVLAATVKAGERISHEVGAGRHAYLVPATGAVEIDGERYEARDGIALSGGQTVTITALADAELVLVDSL
ncbi:pirin family protein [Sphingomonas sp. HHU CXW]|uniref:Pirin family protein n=1 Tax=Sphingomonas hominis TaxID=2741495 RepID=A0ABX2JPI3_9SPHN|nr:pirin family protein [Sphingomonas hominis]NTS65007.1 pirin family protein [Sphingomonas hominis]